MAISAFMGNTYGLEISKNLRKVLAAMFVALIFVSYFFLFSLQIKDFFEFLAVIHLVNWIITVFREEFILRSVIQTESEGVYLKAAFLKYQNRYGLHQLFSQFGI